MLSRAVFLDRDGTMAPDIPYCSRPEDFNLFPESAKAIRRLKANGFKVIVITNQSGVARGYFSEDTLMKIHEKMERELSREDAHLDGIYYCPHHPDEGCECRKPKPQMILRAAQEHGINLLKSVMIGNSSADIEAGKAAGCKTILIASSQPTDEAIASRPDAVAAHLLEAAEVLKKESAA